MKANALLLLLLLIAPCAAALRNPFFPPDALCPPPDIQYRGLVRQAAEARALLYLNHQQWLRVSPGERLPNGGRVRQISDHSIQIATADCPVISLPISHKEPPHALASLPAHPASD